jgi:hypothetical protein
MESGIEQPDFLDPNVVSLHNSTHASRRFIIDTDEIKSGWVPHFEKEVVLQRFVPRPKLSNHDISIGLMMNTPTKVRVHLGRCFQ